MVADHQNSLEDIDQIRAEHCALALLRALDNSPGYTLNTTVLLSWLRTIAVVATHDELTETVSKLEGLGLIKAEAASGVSVLELLESGQDVAQGRVVVEGVLRPEPGCPY